MKNKKQTKAELITELYELSTQMREVAQKMEYYAGFGRDVKIHAAQLFGAANMTKSWAHGISGEEIDR